MVAFLFCITIQSSYRTLHTHINKRISGMRVQTASRNFTTILAQGLDTVATIHIGKGVEYAS
jgi:hypothetical protein